MEKNVKVEMLPPQCFDGAGEYVLPDYQGDVKRILSQDAVFTPAGKFINDGDLEISGTVNFRVLYLDTDGKPTAASFPLDFEATVSQKTENMQDAFPELVLTGYQIRSVGPRKLSAKYTVCLIGTKQIGMVPTGVEGLFESENTEVLKKPISERTIRHGTSDEREFAEEMTRLEEIDPESVEVLQASGSVVVEESQAEEDGIRVRGRLILSAVISTPDQPPFVIVREVPFEEVIPIEDGLPDAQTTARGVLTSVTANAGAGENGDCLITVDAIAEFSGEENGNLTHDVPVDAYTVDFPSDVQTIDYAYEEFSGCVACPLTLKVSETPKDEERTDLRQIVSATSAVRIKSQTPTADGVKLTGEVTVCAVGSVIEGDALRLASRKFGAEFEQTLKMPLRAEEKTKLQLALTPVNTSVMIDGDLLTANVLCSLSVTAVTPKTVSVFAGITRRETEGKEPPVLRVVFPEKEDTLWSLGKKYRKPIAALAEQNGLTVPASAGADTPLGDRPIYIY
ncbi:MAG: DUF3794 domain-containing protein [Clostridia bacterium]|nr:DUF3794 domain-containing protein [Clostridia bacterium]